MQVMSAVGLIDRGVAIRQQLHLKLPVLPHNRCVGLLLNREQVHQAQLH